MSQEVWRLLEPHEMVERGDQVWCGDDGWQEAGNAGMPQDGEWFYRRRIPQPKPLVWSWGKTNKEGIWAFGGHDAQPSLRVVRGVPGLDLQSNDDGWVCYLGPIPTIELPPKKYRVPELPKDYGKECEFSKDSQFQNPTTAVLVGYRKACCNDRTPWVGQQSVVTLFCEFARIEVTE